MNIFLTILSILAMAGLSFLVIRRSLPRLRESDERKFFCGLLIVAAVLLSVISIGIAFLPSYTKGVIDRGISAAESVIDLHFPDYKDAPLDEAKLKEITSSPRTLKSAVNERADVGLVAGLLGVNRVISSLESLADNVDAYKAEFDSEGQAFTLHNILGFTARKSVALVGKVVNVLHLVIILLFGLLCAGIAIHSRTEK